MMGRVEENHIVVAEAEIEAEVGVGIETKAANQVVVGVERLEAKAEIDMIEAIEAHVHQLESLLKVENLIRINPKKKRASLIKGFDR